MSSLGCKLFGGLQDLKAKAQNSSTQFLVVHDCALDTGLDCTFTYHSFSKTCVCSEKFEVIGVKSCDFATGKELAQISMVCRNRQMGLDEENC